MRLFALCLVACVPTNNRTYRASDGATVSGTLVPGATRVEVATVDAPGEFSLITKADLSTPTFTVTLPSGETGFVVFAQNGAGAVIGSAIAETTGEAGSTAKVPPMSDETHLEATVYMAHPQLDRADLRARVDATMTVLDASALGSAVAAAQLAKVRAYARAGVNVTNEQLGNASLPASLALSAALDAGADGPYAAFHSAVDAALETLGADVQKRARAEIDASRAFRRAIGVSEAARNAAWLEARAVGAAVIALLEGEAKTRAEVAVSTLLASIQSGGSPAQAWTTFRATLTAGRDVAVADAAAMTLSAASNDDAFVAFEAAVAEPVLVLVMGSFR